MNILLINVPSRRGKSGFTLPLGLLYVGSIVERSGHHAKLFDPYLDDCDLKTYDSLSFEEQFHQILDEYKPDVVGFGGIATSYGRTKQLSYSIKKRYPDIFQIAGGPLSSVHELLLTKTPIDLVFHGETEFSLPDFLEKVSQSKSYLDIPGISYLSNEKIIRNSNPEQIANLDDVPIPKYDLLDLRRYFYSTEEWFSNNKTSMLSEYQYVDIHKRIIDKPNYIPIISSRGCVRRCSFCYRHVRGYRMHSVDYMVRHMKYLIDTYGIKGFQFCDELFSAKPERIFKFCDAIEHNDLDIFYRVSGLRVDSINEEALVRLKQTGCVEIDYGQESGSDTILKEYGKGVTRKKNTEITVLTSKKIGIFTTVQIVIGSPGENGKTISETIGFLKDVDAFGYSLNYLIPFPDTPIWKHVLENNLVWDVEKYLDDVALFGGTKPLVNLTSAPWRELAYWDLKILFQLKLYFLKRTNIFLYLIYCPIFWLADFVLPFLPRDITRRMLKNINQIINSK